MRMSMVGPQPPQFLEVAMSDPTESPDAGSPDGTPTPDIESSPRSGLLKGRLVVASAAIAVGLIAAVVIVSLTNESSDESADPAEPSDAVDIAAGDTVTEDPGTTGGEDGPTIAPNTWQVVTTGPFEIDLRPSEAGLATITVSDPATPTLDTLDAQHCVLVTLAGPATVETYGCATIGGTDTVELVLSTPGDPLVGCAAVVTNEASGEPTSVDATTTFVVSDSPGLPAGDYDVTVVAVTGTGDGCPPTDGVTEHEATAETSVAIT
jgi:hypothetical protein